MILSAEDLKSKGIQMPTGPTSSKWYAEGYQAAMADMLNLFDSAEPDHNNLGRMLAWIEVNTRAK